MAPRGRARQQSRDLQNPTIGVTVTINNKSTTTEPPP